MSRSAADVDVDKATFSLWLASPPSCDKPESSPRLMLDVPPRDVRSRIAHFVSRASQTNELLALARTNATQRSAVLDALHHRFVLCPVFQPERLARWLETVLQDVKELVCEQHCLRYAAPALQPHNVALCQASTLRRVTLDCPDMDVLDAIQHSPSIREVKARLHDNTRVRPLLKALRTLDLKSIELVCATASGNDCCLAEAADLFNYEENSTCRLGEPVDLLNGEEKSISSWYSNLRTFHVSCDKHVTESKVAEEIQKLLLRNLRNFRKLEAVTLHDKPLDEMIVLLDGMQEVRLQDGQQSTYWRKFPRGLAPCLTGLLTNACFSQTDRENLADCVRLKQLETTLECGLEIEFGQVLRRLNQLRELTVRWWWSDTDGIGIMHREDSLYATPTPKDLVALIVDNVPQVEKLRLREVWIAKEDIASILRSVGTRLKEFEVPFLEQDETPLRRLVTLLELVMVNCPGLQRLASPVCDMMWTENGRNDFDESEMKRQLLDAERILRMMERQVPFLDMSKIEFELGSVRRQLQDSVRHWMHPKVRLRR